MTDDKRSISHDDLVMLTAWMADNGFSASEVAAAVEKPWHYADELVAAALAEADDLEA